MRSRPIDRSTRTRAAIFAAGAELFARKGFRETGIRDIAAAAGVNPALISYHFGGKGGLYDAILRDCVEAAAIAARQGAIGEDRFPEERLVRLFADVLSVRPHLVPMILREHMEPNRLSDLGTMQILMGFMDITRSVLNTLPLDHEARSWDPHIIHFLIVGPLIHFLVSSPFRGAAAREIGTDLTDPSLDKFVETQAAVLRRALRYGSH